MNEAKYLIIDTTYMLKNEIFYYTKNEHFYPFKVIKKRNLKFKKKQLLDNTYSYEEAIKKIKKIRSLVFKKEKEKRNFKLLRIK